MTEIFKRFFNYMSASIFSERSCIRTQARDLPLTATTTKPQTWLISRVNPSSVRSLSARRRVHRAARRRRPTDTSCRRIGRRRRRPRRTRPRVTTSQVTHRSGLLRRPRWAQPRRRRRSPMKVSPRVTLWSRMEEGTMEVRPNFTLLKPQQNYDWHL